MPEPAWAIIVPPNEPALNVTDIGAAIDFYSKAFSTKPVKGGEG